MKWMTELDTCYYMLQNPSFYEADIHERGHTDRKLVT